MTEVFIVVAYDENGKFAGVLAVKATEVETETVIQKWVEIVDTIDVERWTIGDEAEITPEQSLFP